MVNNFTNINKKNNHLIEHKKRSWHMMLEIQILAWDRHKNVAEWNLLMGSQLSSLDNWISNGNT